MKKEKPNLTFKWISWGLFLLVLIFNIYRFFSPNSTAEEKAMSLLIALVLILYFISYKVYRAIKNGTWND